MNTVVEGMLQKYQPRSEEEYENALKEIIQEIALLGMWRSKFFEVGGFYGGTALRILYGLDLFSEDLDFSLLAPDPQFSLAHFEVFLRNELAAFGFEVTVKRKENTKSSAIESAFIKANTSEHLLEVAPMLIRHNRKILRIKIEVDTNPPGFEVVEVRPHFKPIPFGVKTVTLPTLFAGKIAACLFRPYQNWVKGRDWFDFLW
jgi:predicted nucleotidyltransferase component of viral defense system